MIKKALLVSAISLGFSGFAQAEFVQGDWLVQGDGLSTLDTRTGKEWLRLTETAGMTLEEITLALDNELSGWNFAGFEDVLSLTQSQFEIAGINYAYSDVRLGFMRAPDGTSSLSNVFVDEQNSEAFSDAFGGPTVESYSNFAEHGVYGTYVSEYKDGKIGFFSSQYSDTNISSSGLLITTMNQTAITNSGAGSVGWWLVNDGGVSFSSINDPSINTPSVSANEVSESVVSDVPAPLSLGLFAFAAMGFAGLRRKQK